MAAAQPPAQPPALPDTGGGAAGAPRGAGPGIDESMGLDENSRCVAKVAFVLIQLIVGP